MDNDEHYWKGKSIKELTRDELLEVIRQLSASLDRMHTNAQAQARLFREATLSRYAPLGM